MEHWTTTKQPIWLENHCGAFSGDIIAQSVLCLVRRQLDRQALCLDCLKATSSRMLRSSCEEQSPEKPACQPRGSSLVPHVCARSPLEFPSSSHRSSAKPLNHCHNAVPPINSAWGGRKCPNNEPTIPSNSSLERLAHERPLHSRSRCALGVPCPRAWTFRHSPTSTTFLTISAH